MRRWFYDGHTAVEKALERKVPLYWFAWQGGYTEYYVGALPKYLSEEVRKGRLTAQRIPRTRFGEVRAGRL